VIDPPTLVRIAQDRSRIDLQHKLVAPNGIRSQALDMLLLSVRSGELSEKAALELHEQITEVKIRLLGDRVSRRTAWQLAREHDWPTIREAEYLAMTKLQADALIAADPAIAAKASGIVPIARLDDLLTK
jgi:predicted nucleic acid-binding protein